MSKPEGRGKKKTVVVGVGNDFRNDDAAGLAALRAFRSRNVPGVDTYELHDDLTRLLNHVSGVATIYIIDAVRSQSPPGTIHHLDSTSNDLSPHHSPRSTHGISLGDLLELVRLHEDPPKKIVLYGIEGERFDYGTTMTAAVQDAVPQVVERICTEIEGDQSPWGEPR